MSLSVLDERERLVESHRLIVQDGCSEGCQVMTFNICTGVGNQCETGGMRFRKAVQRERRNRMHNFVLRITGNAVVLHTASQLDFNFLHTRFRSLEPKSSTQFFSFPACEARTNHCHAQQLLLKKRYSQGSFQY